ncbi:HAD family hydrolase [Odoribacter lunatus]|uniref:HAD family hydrolase n=1 Tax=Odoribacter lunatus TaxID=2941335 RepID=UPI00203D12D5|nr:HAD family phosphatase [Odoribacter lunatus]
MKNIVFDLGGVVVDWNPAKVEKEYNGDKGLPQFLFHSGFFKTHWTEFDRGVQTEKEMIRAMADISGFPLSECENFMAFIKYSLTDIPKTIELIHNLSIKGYSLYCLSNMSNEFYDYLKVRDVFRYFKGQIISAHEKTVKPEPEIFRLLLSRFSLKAEECLFIDDLPDNIQAAADMGFNTVLFADKEKGYQTIEQLLSLNSPDK